MRRLMLIVDEQNAFARLQVPKLDAVRKPRLGVRHVTLGVVLGESLIGQAVKVGEGFGR
jgi:hypothetical protein